MTEIKRPNETTVSATPVITNTLCDVECESVCENSATNSIYYI